MYNINMLKYITSALGQAFGSEHALVHIIMHA